MGRVTAEKMRACGVPAIIGNAGVNGHSSVERIYSMGLWLNKTLNLKTKVTLFYLGINDAVLLSRAGLDAIATVGTWPHIRRHFINNSASIRLIRIVRGSFRAKRLKIVCEQSPPELLRQGTNSKIDATLYRTAVLAYGDRVRRLSERTVRKGALSIFIS